MGTKEEQIYFYNMFDEMWPKEATFTPIDLPNQIEKMERDQITFAMEATNNNKTKAANLLGIGRTNLIAKLKKYNF